jgi:hypothetical protein
MILLHIIADEEDQAIEIIDFLMEKNMIIEAVLLETVSVRKKKENQKPENTTQTLVMGKTKALLFNSIDQLLREKYQENMPIIYSTPIVNMDWEQSKKLVSDVAKV